MEKKTGGVPKHYENFLLFAILTGRKYINHTRG